MSAAPALALLKPLVLEVKAGPHRGLIVKVAKPIFKIGRVPENDMVLDKDPKVSRYQAEIRQLDGQVTIHNLSDKTDLSINGQKMKGAILNGECEIQIGETKFAFRFDSNFQIPAPAPVPQLQSVTHQASNALSQAPVSAPFIEGNTVSAVIRQAHLAPLSPGSTHQGPNPVLANWAQTSGMAVPPAEPHNPNSFFGGAAAPQPQFRRSEGFFTGRIRFYAIIMILGGLAFWYFNEPEKPSVTKIERTSYDRDQDIIKSEDMMRQISQKKQDKGQQTLQYDLAQEHYIKGFRDYRQGQYNRAISSFAAALSFYPQHDLAKKYHQLAKKKSDEMIGYQMRQGQIYRSKSNFRLCAASFSAALYLIKDQNEPRYREAKQYMEECTFMMEGRF